MPVAAIAAVGVTALGAGASAIAKRNAAKKAASAQKDAIQEQEAILRKNLNPAALNRLAKETDRSRALSRIELQREVDPELADLREFSKQRLLELSKVDPATQQSQQVANQLFEENIQADPRIEALKDSIIQRAQEDFDLGATLPPEFQAELVRSGLQIGGQSGIGTSSRSVGGVTSRLLGSAGVQLAQQRAQEGAALAGVADSLAQSRQRLLSNIFPTVKVQEDAQYGRAIQGLGIAESALPESGLSGTEAVNIEIAKQKGLADTRGQLGAVKAGEAQAKGDFTAGLIGAGTGLLTGAIPAIPGRAPAAPNTLGVGGTGAQLDIGQFGRRNAAQQANFNFLSNYYQ